MLVEVQNGSDNRLLLSNRQHAEGCQGYGRCISGDGTVGASSFSEEGDPSRSDWGRSCGNRNSPPRQPGCYASQRVSAYHPIAGQHASVVALAGALYLAFGAHNRSLALLGTVWRVAEGVIIAFNEVNNVVLLPVAQRFVAATGVEAIALEAMARTLILAEDWGPKIGLADVCYSVRLERKRAASPGLVGACCQPSCRRGKVVSSVQPRCRVGCDQLCAHHAL